MSHFQAELTIIAAIAKDNYMFLKSIFTPAQQRHLFDAFCTFQKFEVCALLQNVVFFFHFSLHIQDILIHNI